MPLPHWPVSLGRPTSRATRTVLTRIAVGAALVLGAGLIASGPDPAPTLDLPSARTVAFGTGTLWVSSPTDEARRLQVLPSSAGPATGEIVVDPGQRRQDWWGTGATLTDASQLLLRAHPSAITQLFDPGAAQGAHLNLLRLPLTATDFSPTMWTWGWDGRTATPSPEAQAAAGLVAGPIRAARPDLRVVATPWSAPLSMKSTATLRGGGLLAGAEGQYGAMLASQAGWLKAHKVPLWAMTLGNEPGYGTDYPTMTMTDAQMAGLGQTVGPRLDRLHVGLWALDHNWSDRARVDNLLHAAPGAFDAAAFHCYGGRSSQMAGLTVARLVTECTGTTDGWTGTFAWDARNLVTDAVAAGSSGLMMWNLALDEQHGPLDAGSTYGCKNCRGLLTVTPDGLQRQPEFYTLAQLSRAASPGARVVSSTASSGLDVAAFRNADGTVGVFGHNSTGTEQVVRIRVVGGTTVGYTVEPGELFTYRSP